MSSRFTQLQVKKSPWMMGGILILALVLRGYHMTGFVLNQTEAHWLLYSLHKELLFEHQGTSYPRPDMLFPLLLSLPAAVFGPNELAVRIFTILFGSLSIFPLRMFVCRVTGSEKIGMVAALLLAVVPLHVFFSQRGAPDVISLFFVLCALASLSRSGEENAGPNFWIVGGCMAVALFAKATALYFWVFLALLGFFYFPQGRVRRNFYLALGASLIPLASFTTAIQLRGSPLSFFQESVATRAFGFAWRNILNQVWYGIVFFDVTVIAAGWGVFSVLRGGGSASPSHFSRRLLWFLIPLAFLVVTPFFRVSSHELLLLIPTVCLFGAIALHPTTRGRQGAIVVVVVALLLRSLLGVSHPRIAVAPSVTDRTTAVLDRPAGWPSRDASRWLLAHTGQDEVTLIATFTYTDAVLLELQRQGRKVYPMYANFELLRDPANQVKYLVFVDDYHAYAPPLFLQYADSHFSRPPDAHFTNYTILSTQKEGRFVAYPDAFSSPDSYVRRATALFQKKEFLPAMEALQIALLLDPTLTPAKKNLMMVYLAMDRKEDALRIGQDVLAGVPDDAQINLNLALLDLALGRWEEGVAQCEKNIRLHIFPAVSYGVLGQLREQKGDFAAAVSAYEKSLALDSTNVVTQQLLGKVLDKRKSVPTPP